MSAEVVVIRDVAMVKLVGDVECRERSVVIGEGWVLVCGRYLLEVSVPRDVRKVVLGVGGEAYLLDCLDGVCIG